MRPSHQFVYGSRATGLVALRPVSLREEEAWKARSKVVPRSKAGSQSVGVTRIQRVVGVHRASFPHPAYTPSPLPTPPPEPKSLFTSLPKSELLRAV